MDFDRAAPRRAVNLNLNSDLVERCKARVENLSAHVEALLAEDLERREARVQREKANTARAIDAFAEYYHKYGSLSEQLESE